MVEKANLAPLIKKEIAISVDLPRSLDRESLGSMLPGHESVVLV